MTQLRVFLMFLCVLGVAGVASPQATSSQAQTKNIVTASSNAAVLQTSEAQKSLSALQSRFAPKQEQLCGSRCFKT